MKPSLLLPLLPFLLTGCDPTGGLIELELAPPNPSECVQVEGEAPEGARLSIDKVVTLANKAGLECNIMPDSSVGRVLLYAPSRHRWCVLLPHCSSSAHPGSKGVLIVVRDPTGEAKVHFLK